MEKIKDRLKKYIALFQEKLVFFLILVMFLPNYLRYPLFIVLMIYCCYELFKYRDIHPLKALVFLVFTFGLALKSHNAAGMGLTLLYLGVIPYYAAIRRRITDDNFNEIQYYVVWSSLVSFPLVYTNYEPRWYQIIESTIMNLLDLSNLPVWKLPEYGNGYYRAYATFDNPNFYAFILMLVLIVCINQIERRIRQKAYGHLIFYIGAFLINAYAMLLTGTRSVLVATLVSTIVLILVQQKWQQLKFMIMIGSLGLAFLIVNPSVIPRLLDINAHIGIRTDIWKNAFSVIKNRPWFGDGFGSYALYFDTVHAHNIYIELLLSLGVIGFGFLVVSTILIVVSYLKRTAAGYLPFALAIIIGLLIFGILDFPFYYLQTTYLFVAVLVFPKLNHESSISEHEAIDSNQTLPKM